MTIGSNKRQVLSAAAVAGLAISASAEPPPAADGTAAAPQVAPLAAGDAENAKERMRFMVEACQKYEMAYGDPPQIAKLRPEAVLRWSNPVSTVKDGGLFVYVRDGRPDVVVEFQIHNEQYAVHEFSPVAHEGLTMRRAGNAVWRPDSGWFGFRDQPDAPAPADSPAGRLVQMRRLAGGFEVLDDFGFREEQITRQKLRLLNQPVYRYGGTGDVTDGALFVFAQGTNPEACLLIEAFRDGDRAGWRYGFLPTTIYKLDAYLGGEADGELVWTKPRRLVFNSSDGPYHVGPYRPDPGDVNLEGAMPRSE